MSKRKPADAPPQYVVGIDLGTTNSVLAYAPLDAEGAQAIVLPLPQLTAPSTVEARGMLPSFLYLGTQEEAASGAFDLPWRRKSAEAVGELARKQSADVP